jgi:HK97 family phage portal protein
VDLFRRAAATLSTVGPMASLENPQVPISSANIASMFGPESGTHTGRAVTPETALCISAVWRAVNLISTTSAGLPMHAYKNSEDDDIRRRAGGAAARLIADPHPDLTPLELWELVYGSLCLYGNAYLLKLHNRVNELSELWWVNPTRVKVMRLDKGPDAGQKRYVLDGNEDQPYSDKLMLHIPGFGYDGVCGVSPIRAAREGLGLSLAAEEFGGRFYGSGSLATGILQTEQVIDQTQAERLKALWKLGGSGLDSAHDIRVIGAGAKFQQLTIAPEDAQFLETREFQVTDVARWFGIPPHLLMQTEKSTSWGTGIAAQNLAFVQYTLGGYLQRVEQRLTKAVRPGPVYIRYALEGFLRGDPASRAAFYKAMWDFGAFSTNDIRRLEDMEPVDGGDTRYVPLNYGVLGAPADAPTLTELPALTSGETDA